MKILRAVTPIIFMLLLATAASAVELTGQSRTYLMSRETADSSKFLPLYEYLDFRADNVGSQVVSFHAGGWYRVDLQDESYNGTTSTGDLQYAYIGLKGSRGNAYLNLGRVLVNQGVAVSQVDGMSAGTDLRWGFGISAFGGIPVATASDSRTGDSIYGGRISQGRDGLYRIGVSYLFERNDNIDSRKEAGLDLYLRLFDKFELMGLSQYNDITKTCAKRSAYLTLGPFKALTLRGEYTQISYEDFFTSPTLSVFKLQAGGPVDPKEKMKSAGGGATLAIGPVSISADARVYEYDIAGNARYYGGRIAYTGTQNLLFGITGYRMNGEKDTMRYNEYRIYGYKKFEKADISADVLTTQYDAEQNGVKEAVSASLAVGYAFTDKLRLGADVEYAKNPYFIEDIRGMVKLVYNFDVKSSAPAAPKGRK